MNTKFDGTNGKSSPDVYRRNETGRNSQAGSDIKILKSMILARLRKSA